MLVEGDDATLDLIHIEGNLKAFVGKFQLVQNTNVCVGVRFADEGKFSVPNLQTGRRADIFRACVACGSFGSYGNDKIRAAFSPAQRHADPRLLWHGNIANNRAACLFGNKCSTFENPIVFVACVRPKAVLGWPGMNDFPSVSRTDHGTNIVAS